MPGKKRTATTPTIVEVSEKDITRYPRKFFPRYWEYSRSMREARSSGVKYDLTEVAFQRVFGRAVPDGLHPNHAEVIARYGLMQHDADLYNVCDLGEQFKRRYAAAMKLADGLDDFNGMTRVPITIHIPADDELAEPEEGEMAAKKKTTTTTTKKATAKKKAPAKKKVVAKKEKKIGATSRVCELLCERAHTDEEIIKIIEKEYPDRNEKQIKMYLSCQRGDINSGRKPIWTGLAKADENPIVRLYRDAKGKVTTEKSAAA